MHTVATLDNTNWISGMNQMRKSVTDTINTVENAGMKMESVFKNIAGLAGISFGVAGAQAFVSKVAEMRTYFQDIESSMKVFLGNEEKATEFTKKLKDYAYYNMFEFKDLAAASQQMIAYGHDVDTIIPRLDQLSNVAQGTHAPLMEMVAAYNKAKSTGVVDAQGMQSWAVKGVVIRDVLKEMGEVATGSTITFEQLNKVLDKITGEGGMFHNLMAEQMENISAEIGQYEDNLANKLNEIGEKYQDVIVNWYKLKGDVVDNIDELSGGMIDAGFKAAGFVIEELRDNYKELATIIRDAVVAYGLYKAALITANAVEKTHIFLLGLKDEAMVQNALATEEEIAQQGRATAATVLHDRAVKALNSSLLKNPYVLAAAAVAALVFTLYKLNSGETEVEKAQKRASETLESLNEQYDNRKQKVSSMISALQNENATDLEIAQAWLDLQSALNALGMSYSLAELQAMGFEEAERLAKEAAEEEKYTELSEKVQGLKDKQQELKESYDILLKNNVYGNQSAAMAKIAESLKGVNAELDIYLEQLEKMDKAKEVVEDSNNAPKTPLAESYKNLKGEYDKQKKLYDKAVADARAGRQTLDEEGNILDASGFDKLTKAYKKAKADFEAVGGDTNKNTAKNASRSRQQLFEYEQKMLEDQIKQEREAYNARESERISHITNSGQRERAEQDNQHRLALQQIELQAEDMRKAIYENNKKLWEIKNKNSNAQYSDTAEGKAGWRGLTISDDQQAMLDAQTREEEANYNRILEDRIKADREYMLSYLIEYGDFQQQKLAIEEQYNRKIQESSGNPFEVAALERKMEKEISDRQLSDLKESINWEGVFNDLDRYSVDFLENIREKLSEALKNPDLDPENIKVISEKIHDIDEQIRNESESTFNFIGSYAQTTKRLQEEATEAAERYKQALQEETIAKMENMNITEQIRSILNSAGMESEDINFSNKDGIIEQFGRLGNNTEVLSKLFDKLGSSEAKLANKTKKTEQARNEASEAEDKAWQESSKKIAGKLSDIAEFANEYLGDLPNLLDSIGLSGLGDKAQHGLDAVNSAAGAAADFASGNYVGAAFKGISAIKSFGSMLGIGAGNAAEVNRKTEELTKSNDRLADRISDLTEAIGESAGLKALQSYDAAMKAQGELQQNNMEILKLQMGYHSAHHSNAYYADDNVIRDLYNQSRNTLAQAGYQLGTITGLSSIYNLTPEQLKAIKDYAPKLWEYLTTVGKYDKSEFWESVVDQAGKAADLTDKINSNLTKTSFSDMRSSYQSFLMDTTKDTEDWAEDITRIITEAMINSFVLDDEFDEWLNGDNGWLKRYAETMRNSNLSDAERKKQLDVLLEEQRVMADQKKAEAQGIMDLTGYSNTSTYEQSASAKAWGSMSQDTAEELNGRFTALQISGANIDSNVAIILSNIQALKEVTLVSNGVLSEIRNLHIISNDYLEDIRSYTKTMVSFGDKLDKLVENTK